MKKFMIGVFACDLIFLSLITVFADSYDTAGEVELHVTLLRIVIEAAVIGALNLVQKNG